MVGLSDQGDVETTATMNVTVIIPTYRRPSYLERCLRAVLAQSRAPDQIVVVRRREDEDGRMVLQRFQDSLLDEVTVNEPGVLAAIERGLEAARGEVVAFIDDDATPHLDWLERLLAHLEEPTVGGVGGRDIWRSDEPRSDAPTADVGRITSWGKLVGNHHVGVGPARDVMVLQAVGAFRREALALPRGLRGTGAQSHFEVGLSLWACKQGWRLVYDPSIVIDHFRAPRADYGRRDRPNLAAIRDRSYNLVASIVALEPRLLRRRAAFGLLVGDRENPGVIRGAVAAIAVQGDVVRAIAPSLAGQAGALVDFARGRRIRMVPADGASERQPRRKPSVALVAHDIHDEGGMERVFAELIRHGHDSVDFVVVAGRLSKELRSLVRWYRVPIPQRPFPLKFASFFLFAPWVMRRISTDLVETMGAIIPNRVDVASVHFCHAGFVQAAGRLAPQGMPPLRRLNTGIARVLALAAERWCYRTTRARALATVSERMTEEIAAHYPGLPLFVTPNGVDLERFRPDPIARRELRGEERVRRDDVVAVFVGGDWERKGLALAIEGIARASHQADVEILLWVVGRGNRRRYQRIARRNGVRSQVKFFGRRLDTERFYAAADMFVLPTLYESFSLVAFEAAASGLPIVATRVSGIDELLDDDRAGIVVERTPEAIASAIERLATDPEERARLGEEAQRRASQYTWERSAASALELCHALIEEQGSKRLVSAVMS
jgi:glycosyltransferase involved in cell wall biosynthesis/GT2 family glycosyltransferase